MQKQPICFNYYTLTATESQLACSTSNNVSIIGKNVEKIDFLIFAGYDKYKRGDQMDELVQEHTRFKFLGHIMTWPTIGNGKLHWHENCELCRVVCKPCRFLIDGQLVDANVGDILFINEYTVHKFIIKEPNTQVYILQFQWNSFVKLNFPHQNIKRYISIEEIRSVPGLEEKIDFFMNSICTENNITNNENENPALFGMITALYYLLLRYFPQNKKEQTFQKDRNEFFAVVAYINDHFNDPLTVNILADKMFMSRAKLSVLFQKFTGISIKEYIHSLRVKKVNLMLHQGHSITETAFECGFQSVRTFNNVYKKLTGKSPSEYMRELGTK